MRSFDIILTLAMATVVMVTDIYCHWYRRMANSVCHAPSIFQLYYKLKFFSLLETSDFKKKNNNK